MNKISDLEYEHALTIVAQYEKENPIDYTCSCEPIVIDLTNTEFLSLPWCWKHDSPRKYIKKLPDVMVP